MGADLDPAMYALGIAGLAVIFAALWWGAAALRARITPAWSGPPARVLEAVVVATALTLLLQLLGLIGIISGLSVLLTSVLAGVTLRFASQKLPLAEKSRPSAPRSPRQLDIVAFVVAAVAVGHWMAGMQPSLALGMQGFDTLWYHGPFAARIAESGSFLPLHFTDAQYLNWFYPENSELLHAGGIAFFGNDLLSPWLGLAWFGLALVAAWSIGRPYGVAPLSLVAVACVLDSATLIPRSAGNAATDIEPIALMLAAAAILVTAAPVSRGRRSPELARSLPLIGVAGLALGLALGSKLTMLLPALFLGVGLISWTSRSKRVRIGTVWFAGVLIPSAVWFVRNLVYSGNPFPFSSFGPIDLGGPDRGGAGREPFSVAHYLFDKSTAVETSFFYDGLVANFGWLWPLVFLIAAAGAVLALWRGSSSLRAVGLACLAGGIGYLFTPLSAAGPEGSPVAFEINLRYLVPALAPAMALFVCDRLVAGSGRLDRRLMWLVGLTLIFASVVIPGIGSGSADSWSEPRTSPFVALGFGLVAITVAIGISYLSNRVKRYKILVVCGVIAVAVAVGGYFVSREYLDSRYVERVNDRTFGFSITQAARLAAGLEGQRIGVSGSAGGYYQYPLYGSDLSNYVQYIGVESGNGGFREIDNCADWRRAVNQGKYSYLLLAPTLDLSHPSIVTGAPEFGWIDRDPAAKMVRRRGKVRVFRIDGRLDPAACPDLRPRIGPKSSG